MNDLDQEDFAADFLKKLEKLLGEKLQEMQVGENTAKQPPLAEEFVVKHPFEMFMYFLRHGVLPWWATETQLWDFEKKTERGEVESVGPEHWEELKEMLHEKPFVKRLTHQFTEKFRLVVIEKVYGLKKGSIRSRLGAWNEQIRKMEDVACMGLEEGRLLGRLLEEKYLRHGLPATGHFIDEVISELVFEFLKPGAAAFENLLHNLGLNTDNIRQKNHLLNEEIRSEEQRENPEAARTKRPMLKTDAYFIENAGLVLTAAFLPQFLNACGVAGDKEILRPDEAVHLIQFLISETSTNHESALPLNKLLCGMAIEQPVSEGVTIDEEQFNQTNHLLDALLEYWPSMKGTSRQGLRESFLKRSGKLTHEDGKWLLQVTNAPYDMLLKDLPWTYNIISLPWMKEPLYVEWHV